MISLIDQPTQEYAKLKMPVSFALSDGKTTFIKDIQKIETSTTPPSSQSNFNMEQAATFNLSRDIMVLTIVFGKEEKEEEGRGGD